MLAIDPDRDASRPAPSIGAERRDRPLLRDRAERRDRRRLQADRACASCRVTPRSAPARRSIRSPRSARRRNRCTTRAGRRGSSIGARCQIRESVTMNTGTEEWRRRHHRRRRLLPDGRLACRRTIARSATTSSFANNAVLGGHVDDRRPCVSRRPLRRASVHVRIGESAMVAGYSAVARRRHSRSASCCYPAARPRRHQRRRHAPARRERAPDRGGARRPTQTLFEGEGEFAARVDAGRGRATRRAARSRRSSLSSARAPSGPS